MRQLELAGIQADECRLCDGLWLDDQEPERLVCLSVIPEHVLQPIAFDDSQIKVREGERRCPRCDVVMELHPIREVTVDVCPECRGLWLDRWELQRILAE